MKILNAITLAATLSSVVHPIQAALVDFPEPQQPVVGEEPVIVEVNRRSRKRRAMRNVAIAGVLMMDDEYARCLQEYEIHYGSQVQEGCVRDLMNAESIPQEVRDQWYAERFGSE